MSFSYTIPSTGHSSRLKSEAILGDIHHSDSTYGEYESAFNAFSSYSRVDPLDHSNSTSRTYETALSAFSSYSRVDAVNSVVGTTNNVRGDQTTYESTKIDSRTNYNNATTFTTIDSGNVATNVTRNVVHLFQTVNFHINIRPPQALHARGLLHQSFPANDASLGEHTRTPKSTPSHRPSSPVLSTSNQENFVSVPRDDEREERNVVVAPTGSSLDVDASESCIKYFESLPLQDKEEDKNKAPFAFRKDEDEDHQTTARSDMGKFKRLLGKVVTAFKAVAWKTSRLRKFRIHICDISSHNAPRLDIECTNPTSSQNCAIHVQSHSGTTSVTCTDKQEGITEQSQGNRANVVSNKNLGLLPDGSTFVSPVHCCCPSCVLSRVLDDSEAIRAFEAHTACPKVYLDLPGKGLTALGRARGHKEENRGDEDAPEDVPNSIELTATP